MKIQNKFLVGNLGYSIDFMNLLKGGRGRYCKKN